ncbi:unnamed protein product [Chironomus riparius]|uniref:Uncharacterized protein n=1 Tax=Chironomus riparius TaxID=315576 RepID=A0A9N9RUU7_9DIPT|nr:unnamed protein product [Chironomus riparius]
MKSKTLLTISAVSIYVITIGLIAKSIKEDFDGYNNRQTYGYFRFCSDDTEKYSDDYLLNEFNKSKSANGLKYNNIIIYRGYPLCGAMEFIHPNDNITSENRPYEFYRGSIYIKHEQFNFRRYCLEKSEYEIDGWKVMICNQDEKIHKVFHFFAISISIVIFGLTLAAHIYFKELRDFHGKCAIALVANQILTYILSTCIDLYDFFYDDDEGEILYRILQISVMHTLIWITVMMVHSLLIFINYKNRTTAPLSFSTYAVLVVAFIGLSAIILLTPVFRFGYITLYTACLIISILNIVFVLITAFIVFALSRHPTYSIQARYHYERKLFCTTVKLALIFLVTWIIKFITNHSPFNLMMFITVDSMMLITAITICIILLGRKNVKTLIFEKYRGIKNVEEK